MGSLEELGRFLSLVLRHKPEVIGIKLDENGWANVSELIIKMRMKGKYIDMGILKEIVETNNKKRYSFNEDKTLIRANQGHSIKVDVELKEELPPDILYHGTATRFVESIKEKGLVAGNRLHVHLSRDMETAINVGSRHGKPVVLKIKTKQMSLDGIKFYKSENDCWLVESVPIEYIMLE